MSIKGKRNFWYEESGGTFFRKVTIHQIRLHCITNLKATIDNCASVVTSGVAKYAVINQLQQWTVKPIPCVKKQLVMKYMTCVYIAYNQAYSIY